MRAVANRTEAVKRGDAERGREIAVGAATGGTFPETETHLGR